LVTKLLSDASCNVDAPVTRQIYDFETYKPESTEPVAATGLTFSKVMTLGNFTKSDAGELVTLTAFA